MYNPTKPYKRRVLSLIKQTWHTPYVLVDKWVVRKKFSYPEYHHTDGIGTKGIYYWQARSFKNAVLDALAMNLNDLAMVGTIPYALIDHIMLPKDDSTAILEIVKHLVRECEKRKIAITGGETAIHNNMEGLEISTTMLGFVKKPRTNRFETGDLLIGIASNGLHSNGFTKVREVFGNKKSADLVRPTTIYLDCILGLMVKYDIHGMQHITGGAFTKLKDLLGGKDIIIHRNHKLKPQKVFQELYSKGIADREMYQTFNCGIGFILSVPSKDANKILLQINKFVSSEINKFAFGNINEEFKADIIGEVKKGIGKVKIESMLSKKVVTF